MKSLVTISILFCSLGILSAQNGDCAESNKSKNGQCIRIPYATQAEIDYVLDNPTNANPVSFTIDGGLTWMPNGIVCAPDNNYTTSSVLYAENGANCNCSGNYNIGEDGTFSFSDGTVCTYLPGGTLPAIFTDFIVVNERENVRINWETAIEVNTDFFQVERSGNNLEFEIVGYVNAQGESASREQYSFLDTYPLKGTSYYRITLVDFDLTKTTTNVVSITRDEEPAFLSADGQALYLNGPTGNPIKIGIFNGAGQLLMTQQISPGSPLNISTFSAGVYFAKPSKSSIATLKFIKP